MQKKPAGISSRSDPAIAVLPDAGQWQTAAAPDVGAAAKELLEHLQQEQARIARELYDQHAQNLAGVALLTKLIEYKLKSGGALQPSDCLRVISLLEQAVHEARSLSRQLAPVEAKPHGLRDALTQLAQASNASGKTRCRFVDPANASAYLRTEAKCLDISTATQLYRIAEEAISLAGRPGGGVVIALTCMAGNSLRLLVEGDGEPLKRRRAVVQSVNGEAAVRRRIEVRARLIGAVLEVKPSRSGGSAIACCVRPRRSRI